MTQQGFDVYLDDELIDTVFATGYDCEEMRRSLINHDGYDPRITVKLERKGDKRDMVPGRYTKRARGQ